MLPYLLLLFIVIVSLLLPKKTHKIACLVTFFYMLFLGYFRDETVGTDVLFSHAPNFKVASYKDLEGLPEFGFEPGFMYIMALWKDFVSKDYMQFFGACFVFTTTSFFIFFKRHSPYLLFTILIYILYCFFFISMCIIRQCFCAGILLIVLDFYLRNGKLWFYILFVIICALLFHISSLVFLLVPFVGKVVLKHNNFEKLLLTIVVLLSLLSFYFRDFVISRFEILAQFEALAKFESYVNGSNMNDETKNVTAIFQSFFCIIMIWTYKKNNKTDLFFLSYIIGCVSYNVLSCFSTHTWRIGLPFILLGFLSVTDLWVYSKGKTGRIIVKPAIILFYTGYFIHLTAREMGGVFPYVSRIDLF